MYVGSHVDSRLCPACGDVLRGPQDGCAICWHGESHGVLIQSEELGCWVHQHCLDFFGVDSVLEFEQQYHDL
jgi:hypothetical protein